MNEPPYIWQSIILRVPSSAGFYCSLLCAPYTVSFCTKQVTVRYTGMRHNVIENARRLACSWTYHDGRLCGSALLHCI